MDDIVKKPVSYLIPHLKQSDIKTHQAILQMDTVLSSVIDSVNKIGASQSLTGGTDVSNTPTNSNYVSPVTIVSAFIIPLKDTDKLGILLTYIPNSVKHKGVHLYLEVPDSSFGITVKVNSTPVNSGVIQGKVSDIGVNNSILKADNGSITIIVYTDRSLPKDSEKWRLYVQAIGDSFDPPQVAANLSNPTASIVIVINSSIIGAVGEEFSPNITDATIVLPIEIKFFQSAWFYRATIIWTDPDPIQFPLTIFRFAGVEISVLDITQLKPEDVQFANPFEKDPTSRIRIGKGITKWVSEWIEIPARTEIYEVRLPAYDIFGNVNTISALVTPQAIFSTPDLPTVRLAMTNAIDFSCVAGYGYQPGTGNFDLIVTPKFIRDIDPSVSYYGFAVKIGNGSWVLLGFPTVGDGLTDGDRAYIGIESYPTQHEIWIAVLVSYDINGVSKHPDIGKLEEIQAAGGIPDFGDSPTCIFDVFPQAQELGTGTEYAPLVNNIFGGVYYRQSIDGIETFGFQGFYDIPYDGTSRYQGLIPTVVFVGGVQPVPLLATDKDDVNFKTIDYPLAASSGVMYFLSKDSNGRTNSIVDGITPAIAFVVNPQTTGNIDISRGDPASLGNGVQITPSGGRRKLSIKLKNNTLVADSNGIELGIIPSVSNFAAGIRPTILFASNPPLPDSRYPIGQYGFNTTTKSLLRVDDTGNAWKSGVDTADIALNAIIVGLIAAGSVRTEELFTGEIRVGGGGGKPGRFGVYSSTNQLIGYIGTNGTDEGGWFKELGIGGTSFATAGLISDSAGNILLRNTSIQLNSNNVTSYFRNDSSLYGNGLTIIDNTNSNKVVYTQNGVASFTSSGAVLFSLRSYYISGVGTFPTLTLQDQPVSSSGNSMLLDPSRITFSITGMAYGANGISINGSYLTGPANADGTLADITTKYNNLLALLRQLKIMV